MGRKEEARIKKYLQALGDAMRNRRVELELTQYEIGQAAGLHRTYVTDVENGLRNISLATMVKLARALDTSLSRILIEAEGLLEGDF